MRIFFFPLLFLLLTSCSWLFKGNHEYANDFNSMDKNAMAKKYYTLSANQKIDFSRLKKKESYIRYSNNDVFKILIFNDDGYVYSSQLMPLEMLKKPIPTQQLYRDGLFSINDDVLKIESIAMSPGNVYSVIEEGIIRNDTVFMQKSYDAKRQKNIRKLSGEFTLFAKAKVFAFGDDVYIESGK